MTLQTIDPLTDNSWDAFITGHPDGIIFHHSAWARVLIERYGDALEYYILKDGNGKIVGGAPFFHIKNPIAGNKLICLPSTEYCFPLVNSKYQYENLLAGVVQDVDKHKGVSLEIRGWSGLGDPEEYGLHIGERCLVHTLDLQRNLEEIKGNMTRNGRYNLRHAEKFPITIKLGQDEKDLRILYKFMVDAADRHHILPIAYSFLRSIYRHIIIPGHGLIYFAELHGKVIAANAYFCFKDTALCQFSAYDTRYSEYRATYFLHWKVIEQFHEKSVRYYDFGGTSLINPKLAFFKRCWGADETARSFCYRPGKVDSKPMVVSPLYWVYNGIEKYLPSFARRSLSGLLNKYSVS